MIPVRSEGVTATPQGDEAWNKEKRPELGYEDLLAIAAAASSTGDLETMESIAEKNWIVASRVLSQGGFGKGFIRAVSLDPERAVSLYRLTRWGLEKRAREIFRALVAKAITRSGLRIASRFPRGSLAIRRPYEFADDFDAEETIEGLLEAGRHPKWLSYEDVVGIERVQRKNNAIIVLDTSGSMSGEKITHAAVSASVAAHILRGGVFSIVTFNSSADLFKGANTEANVSSLIEEIMDMVPAGYTNLRDALNLARTEGDKMKGRYAYILITDGDYNVGGDPRQVAMEMSRLNVIFAPGRSRGGRGRRVCEDLAKCGGGRFVRLRSYSQIPYVVPRLLEVG